MKKPQTERALQRQDRVRATMRARREPKMDERLVRASRRVADMLSGGIGVSVLQGLSGQPDDCDCPACNFRRQLLRSQAQGAADGPKPH